MPRSRARSSSSASRTIPSRWVFSQVEDAARKKPRFFLSIVASSSSPRLTRRRISLRRPRMIRRSSGRPMQNETTSWSANGTRTSSDVAIDILSK